MRFVSSVLHIYFLQTPDERTNTKLNNTSNPRTSFDWQICCCWRSVFWWGDNLTSVTMWQQSQYIFQYQTPKY